MGEAKPTAEEPPKEEEKPKETEKPAEEQIPKVEEQSAEQLLAEAAKTIEAAQAPTLVHAKTAELVLRNHEEIASMPKEERVESIKKLQSTVVEKNKKIEDL